ncbi:MAG: acyltransferase family protein [Ornithinimicrobium sp.]|uniref:acyltransferase family protein n=1 Tax=Ornithinimicrobium sp. TaxID=1977084 RepID=UPI003D9B06A5
MTDEKQRMRWMDLLRGGAVVLVVIFHGANTSVAPSPVLMFNEAIGDSRLAALFVASGLLLDSSLAKGPSRYVSGKLRLIVWPYLFWTALMIPLSERSRPLDPVWWIWPSGSHTWFLITLATIYALGFLTRIVRPGWIAFALLVASQFIDRGGFELGPYIHHVTWFGAFFFLGVTLSRHIDGVMAAPVWVFAIGAGVTVVWSVLNALPDPPAARTLTAGVITATAVATIVWVLARLPLVWPLTLIERLGKRSIVTFLLHVPVLRILVNYFGWPRDDWAGFLSLVLTLLLVCIVATRFYPQIRWLFEWPGPARSRPPAVHTDPHAPPASLRP